MKKLILLTLLIVGCEGPEEGCLYDCEGTCNGDAIEDCAGDCSGNAVEDICGECGGDGSTCEQVDGMWSIYYNTLTAIGGFQFKVAGVTVDGVSGGAAEDAGFMITFSASIVLSFNLSGDTIPVGEGVLVVLEVTGDGEACLEDVIISDSSGNALGYTVENCNSINIP